MSIFSESIQSALNRPLNHQILVVKQIITFFFCCIHVTYGQTASKDETESRSLDFLLAKIFEYEENDSIRSIYVDKYIENAKKARALNDLVKGYYIKGVFSKFPLSIEYLDSALVIGQRNNVRKYFPQTHLEYGYALFNSSSYFEAFEHFIKAKRLSDSLGLKTISFAANSNIAFLKEISGDNNGAKNIYLENSLLLPSLFEGKQLIDERLRNYHELAYAYLKIGEFDSTRHYNKIGIFFK